jgi:hypothetical protein
MVPETALAKLDNAVARGDRSPHAITENRWDSTIAGETAAHVGSATPTCTYEIRVVELSNVRDGNPAIKEDDHPGNDTR